MDKLTIGMTAPSSIAIRPAPRRAVTLVEVLCVLVIVTAVAALSLPRIASLRARASELQSLSKLREHGRIFTQYTSDFADTFPCFVDPRTGVSTVEVPSQGIKREIRYLNQDSGWIYGMTERYYNSAPVGSDVLSPIFAARPGNAQRRPSPALYSIVFLADPRYFTWRVSRRITRDARATRMAEVAFPSQNLFLFDYQPMKPIPDLEQRTADRGDPALISVQVDGSARSSDPWRDLAPRGPSRGDWFLDYGGPFKSWVQFTDRGVLGRDFR